jgi:hypothetical protein
MSADTEPLPTAVGPARTVSRDGLVPEPRVTVGNVRDRGGAPGDGEATP